MSGRDLSPQGRSITQAIDQRHLARTRRSRGLGSGAIGLTWFLGLAGSLVAAQTPIGPPVGGKPAAAESAGLPKDLGFSATESGLAYRLFDVPGATHAAIVAALRVGGWHDPAGKTGLAHLLAQHISGAQAARPEEQRWLVRPFGPATVLSLTCPKEAVADRLRDLARLLSGELGFAAEAVRESRVQTLLRIDDLLHGVPGPRLLETARRKLCGGTAAGKQLFGVPEEVERISVDDLRAWFQERCRPEHTSLVVLGAAAGPELEALVREAFVAQGPRTAPAALTVHDSAGAIELDAKHTRIGAPFVSVAIKAPPPDSADWLPFVIAMGAVNARMTRTFGAYRGREADAQFPFFWFAYRYGDGFALINRRGADESDLETVRGEVRAAIKRLRTQGAELGEVQQGAYEAAATNMLPPYERQMEMMARRPELLFPRADTLAMAHVLGWSATMAIDVGKVPVVLVQRALQTALADDNLTWLSLSQAPSRGSK